MKFIASAMQASKRALLFVAAALFAGMLTVGVVGATATQAQAASPEYTYTVRIFSGAQGTFNGEDSVTLTTVAKPGDRISFNQGSVTLNNGSKYYIRGIREAGRDNDTTLKTPSFVVSGDTDLVVSYGVLGDNVEYTVQYVDVDGNELLPSETFYGNVGESPVLAYRYIEGYIPQAYNLTGELYADASKNVYTFTYTPIAVAEEPEEEGTTPEPAPAEEVTEVTVPGEDAPVAAVVAPEEATIGDDANPLGAADEIQDIRDEENPLSSFLGGLIGDEASILNDQYALPLGLGLLAAVALAIILAVILRRRKNQQNVAYSTATSGNASDSAHNVSNSNSDSSESGRS